MSRLGACRAAVLVLAAGCASAGDPPGGPPDQAAPQVVSVVPDSGHVISDLPDEVEITFDEVIAERVASQRPDIAGAVIFSPAAGEVRVGWHRNRLTVKPAGGFVAGRIYRVDLLPVIVDLRQNRMTEGRTIVFSTGPRIPATSLEGAVADWAAGRPAPNALVEAVLLPDSLPYRALTDSTGGFVLRQIPAGDYLVYGVVDQDNNRRRGPREAFDTARVSLADSAVVELYAFAHDTTGPRLRTVELVDTVTIRLTFDRPLDPMLTLDTAMVRVFSAADSTRSLSIRLVGTAAQIDSIRRAEAAARAPADTARPPEPAAGERRPEAPAGAAPPGRQAAGRPAAPPVPPRDSTRAQKMLARRRPPTDARMVVMAEALAVETRYVIEVNGARSLSLNTSTTRGQLSVPRPRQPRTAQPDSARRP